MNKCLFLSCASREFHHIRGQLTKDFRHPSVDVKSHEEVADYNTGLTTLEKLDEYIGRCHAIVHLVGQATGTQAELEGIKALMERHPDLSVRLPQIAPLLAPGAEWRGSYAQWEAYLALYHRIPCFVFIAGESFRRPEEFASSPKERRFQADHYNRLERRDRDRKEFFSQEELRVEMQRSLNEILLPDRFPFRADVSRVLRYSPIQLIGREDEIKLLNDAWLQVRRSELPRPHVLTFVAVGGEGKSSLVANWASGLAAQDWPGCDAAFAWSFYLQGTNEKSAGSSDLFLKEALDFFGAPEMASSSTDATVKAKHLARLVGQRRSLLILDGLEPLQYAPSATIFRPGELKDRAMATLLGDLTASNHGLCVVTTRYNIHELRGQVSAQQVTLARLSRQAGVHLLKSLGVTGSELRSLPLKDGDEKCEKVNEFEKLVEDVKGHALTLTLLGGFLQRAFHGKIRQRDRVKFEKADEKMEGGHVFRTISAYEQWLLSDGGDEGRREVAVLRLMGLFDRPADADCLAALRREIIPGLTEPLTRLDDYDWEYCLSGLEIAKLLTVNRDATGTLVSLDTHPHLREYFARQLRTQQPDAWRAAHRRLYDFLCSNAPSCTQVGPMQILHWLIQSTTPRFIRFGKLRRLLEPFLDNSSLPNRNDLEPLYQAIAHGCQAGIHHQALVDTYATRISRARELFSTNKLGAYRSDLTALACFFEKPWTVIHTPERINQFGLTFILRWNLCEIWLFGHAGYYLRALGRLTEAVSPIQTSLELSVRKKDWDLASIMAGSMSDLQLSLGAVAQAVRVSKDCIKYADKSNNPNWRFISRLIHADAHFQAGDLAGAKTWFSQTVQFWPNDQLESLAQNTFPGFRYCEVELAEAEWIAWWILLNGKDNLSAEMAANIPKYLECCHTVIRPESKIFKWRVSLSPMLEEGLTHLILSRAKFYASLVEESKSYAVALEIDESVACLRRAGTQHMLPHGLLTRAWLRFHTGVRTGPESAEADLDEALDISERGPMRLHMADIYLYRARLFYREKSYPWKSPQDDLATAEKLINDCGYHRRDPELADAKHAIIGRI